MRKYVVGDKFKRVGHLCEIVAYETPNEDGVPRYTVKFFSIDGQERVRIWSEKGIDEKFTHISTPKPKNHLPEELFNV